jgi:hypothetical protein
VPKPPRYYGITSLVRTKGLKYYEPCINFVSVSILRIYLPHTDQKSIFDRIPRQGWCESFQKTQSGLFSDETLPIKEKPKHPKRGEYKEQNGRTHVQEVKQIS